MNSNGLAQLICAAPRTWGQVDEYVEKFSGFSCFDIHAITGFGSSSESRASRSD